MGEVMTGYQSKRAAALDEEGMYLVHHTKSRVFDKLGNKVKEDDDDTQVYTDALTIAYQSGYYAGKKAAQPEQEPVKFNCTVVDDQHPQGIPLEQWGDPPAAQRPWVDLTEHELFSIWMMVPDKTEDRFAFARAVLAKSKERNT
jgi:hypothetical protein